MNKINDDGSDNNNEQQFIPFPPNRDQLRSFKRVIPLSIYDYYIIDVIGEPDKYIDLIQTLKSADQSDTVCIYLNTDGGNLYTTIQIMSAISSTDARVVTYLEGKVCSAASLIFLMGDTKVVNPHCTLMIHNYSQSTSGKGNEIVTQVQYQQSHFLELVNEIYGKFLTPEEISEVMKGSDIWMGSREVIERLQANGHDCIYTGGGNVPSVEIESTVVGKNKKTI